jgi:hypothetical protein
MKAVVLAEMLRETLDAKINKIRREIRDTYMPIEVERLEAQIMAYQWVQARLQVRMNTPANKTPSYRPPGTRLLEADYKHYSLSGYPAARLVQIQSYEGPNQLYDIKSRYKVLQCWLCRYTA